ncbi:hypothetical protein HMPREF9946_00657 [Acetobacteraceae bacterium AT-5844]|nr:hypothetical protein HMPREF9946_00657 [Acetobacteraceae bacterium AT-5844]
MPRRRSGSLPTLERKIHFYKADVGVDDSGRPIPFDAARALSRIGHLPFRDGTGGRYLLSDDGNAVCGWPYSADPLQSMLFCQIRRTGLPQLERAGAVSDLDLDADAGLLEPVHVVFFPNNIVGADFNFYGPRLSRLGFYLRVKSENAVRQVNFIPLLRHDISEQLEHLTEVRLLDFKIKSSYISAVEQADQALGEAFRANARVLDGAADEVQVILRPKKEARIGALRRLIRPLEELVRGPDLREHAERFHVKGTSDLTGRVEIIDLLRDHLISRKQVLRIGERSRAVHTSAAFEAIHEAYGELSSELDRASGIAP